MPRRRWRLLERGPHLQLEGEGGDAKGTHFCQACEAEVTHSSRRCYNCGGEIGGPDQDEFDESQRAHQEKRRAAVERTRERSRAVDSARERARLERLLEEQGLLPAARDERGGSGRPRRPGLPAELGVTVVWVCLFGTVSAVLHLYLSAMWSDAIHWSPIAEVAIAVLVTWSVFQYLK